MIATIDTHILTLAFGMPGGTEWIILLVLGLLIFGRRLPEVGKSLGRGIVEFKRGIKGIEDDVEEESSRPARLSEQSQPRLSEQDQPKQQPSTAGHEGVNPYAAPESGKTE
jgi:sec-independent protein translocase protein TatA